MKKLLHVVEVIVDALGCNDVKRLEAASAALTCGDPSGMRLKIARDALIKGKFRVETPVIISIKLPEGFKGGLCLQDAIMIQEQAVLGVERALEAQQREEAHIHAQG